MDKIDLSKELELILSLPVEKYLTYLDEISKDKHVLLEHELKKYSVRVWNEFPEGSEERKKASYITTVISTEKNNSFKRLWSQNYFFKDKSSPLPIEKEKIEKPKPKAKGVWSLRQRYQFLEDIGVVRSIQTKFNVEDDKHFLIHQLLACDKTTARKLFTGQYSKGELNEYELLKWTKKFKPDKT